MTKGIAGQGEMTRAAYAVVVRLLVFASPLFLLHLYAQHAFDYARTQEHHGDTGLGIAILLGFVTLAMLAGFFLDLVIQIRHKRLATSLADALVLLMLLMPFGWFACNWFGSNDAFYCRIPLALFGDFLSSLNL